MACPHCSQPVRIILTGQKAQLQKVNHPIASSEEIQQAKTRLAEVTKGHQRNNELAALHVKDADLAERLGKLVGNAGGAEGAEGKDGKDGNVENVGKGKQEDNKQSSSLQSFQTPSTFPPPHPIFPPPHPISPTPSHIFPTPSQFPPPHPISPTPHTHTSPAIPQDLLTESRNP